MDKFAEVIARILSGILRSLLIGGEFTIVGTIVLIAIALITFWLLDRLIKRNGWLDMGRKRPIPHESWFAVAGYFFYYGHLYASFCIESLPERERQKFQQELSDILLPLQEKDGSWWDYPLYDYHQQYGTAMALMSLKRCQGSSTLN